MDGETVETVADFILGGSKITADGDCSNEIKMLTPWKESYDQPRQHIKKQRDYFANKGPYSQSYGFSSSHVWMWELVYKESWVLKNWCFWTVVLEKTLESPWTARRSNQSILKEMFIGRTDVEAETPVLWPPDAKNWLIWKDTDAGKDWGQEEIYNLYITTKKKVVMNVLVHVFSGQMHLSLGNKTGSVITGP